MSFGKKGVIPGQPAKNSVPAQRMPQMSDPHAAQRAAFIAAERQRAAEAGDNLGSASSKYHDPGDRQISHYVAASQPKSMVMAYVLWWFVYPFSGHRFYLGDKAGAIKQCGAFLGSLLVMGIAIAADMKAFLPIPGLVFIGVWLWILSDMFFIPGMCRRANAALKPVQGYFD